MITGDIVLHEKVMAAVGDRKVLGVVSGWGLLKKLTATIILTEKEVIFYDPKWTGASKTEIPYPQVVSASLVAQLGGVLTFGIGTQSGKTELMLSSGKKETKEGALELFRMLRDKLSELAAVPISETHNKGMMKEVWSFYAPPQLAVMGAKPGETQAHESIPDQIKQLAELKEAGILTAEEFESKKAELLKRL